MPYVQLAGLSDPIPGKTANALVVQLPSSGDERCIGHGQLKDAPRSASWPTSKEPSTRWRVSRFVIREACAPVNSYADDSVGTAIRSSSTPCRC